MGAVKRMKVHGLLKRLMGDGEEDVEPLEISNEDKIIADEA